jgi:acyl-CoA synthetase (AMP-forming)/AMP-acid ligase II
MIINSHQNIEHRVDLKYNNIGELLLDKVEKTPNKTFILCPGKTLDKCTYSEFLSSVLVIANHLSDSGLETGNTICLVFNNSTEFLLFYFASLLLGIVVVPINPDLSPSGIKYIIENSGANHIYFQECLTKRINEVKNILKKEIDTFVVLPFKQFKSVQFGAKIFPRSELPQINHNARAVIIYTSGTTGNPKGVILSHLNIISDAYSISKWLKFSSNTRTLCILPLYHNNAQITTLMAPLYKGGSTVIVKGNVSIMAFWELVEKYEVTWSSVMASILSILLSLKTERKDNTLKGILCGGQILTSSVQDQFEKRFKVSIYEGYGLTETTSFSCINNYPKNDRVKGSIGQPLPTNYMTIVDEDGNECGPFEEGEICIKGLNVAVEYLGMPEKNKVAFRNGWFHSGDFGFKDDKGYYYFKCRKDNLIIKGGENIYPAELENVLFQHKHIDECAVIGIKDEFLGQNICAFVKVNENVTMDENEIFNFCKGKISSYKLPKKIIIINDLDKLNEIPKGPTKKILYRVLEDYYKKTN